MTPAINSLVKQLVPGTNYKIKITSNQKDILNEVVFYDLYQNELLYKTNHGGRHYEHCTSGQFAEDFVGEYGSFKGEKGEVLSPPFPRIFLGFSSLLFCITRRPGNE